MLSSDLDSSVRCEGTFGLPEILWNGLIGGCSGGGVGAWASSFVAVSEFSRIRKIS